jgi:hypothetical protein
MLSLNSFRLSRIHLPTPLPSGRFCYPALSPLSRLRYYEGSDSCPARRPRRSLRLLRFAFRTSRPQPRRVPERRFASHFSAFGDFQASPSPSRLAASRRRIGFVSYGLSFRFRLLSTSLWATQLPSSTQAVTSCGRDFHPANKASSRTHWDRRPLYEAPCVKFFLGGWMVI